MEDFICIYHANCADGFTAAWIVRNWAKVQSDISSIVFHPGVYQDAPPDVDGKNVILVDFSYKRKVMEDIVHRAKSVKILDHHKTAIEDLQGLAGAECFFDVSRSGAGITWDHFFGDGFARRPFFINIVEDRDLWKFNFPGTRAINACIFSYEYTFENWDMLANASMAFLESDGAAIERKHFKDMKELLTVTTRELEIGGYLVPVANMPYTFSSDAGHTLSEGKLFAACYWDTETHRVFSLRSRQEGMDVSEIAKKYGGGGHKNASGFKVPRDHELALK